MSSRCALTVLNVFFAVGASARVPALMFAGHKVVACATTDLAVALSNRLSAIVADTIGGFVCVHGLEQSMSGGLASHGFQVPQNIDCDIFVVVTDDAANPE